MLLFVWLAGWRQVYAGYQATVDNPGAGFYKELMEQYPDAKVRASFNSCPRTPLFVCACVERLTMVGSFRRSF